MADGSSGYSFGSIFGRTFEERRRAVIRSSAALFTATERRG